MRITKHTQTHTHTHTHTHTRTHTDKIKTKGRGMCYLVCGMMHIKELLLLIGKTSPCGGSGFPLSLSEYSFTNMSYVI